MLLNATRRHQLGNHLSKTPLVNNHFGYLSMQVLSLVEEEGLRIHSKYGCPYPRT